MCQDVKLDGEDTWHRYAAGTYWEVAGNSAGDRRPLTPPPPPQLYVTCECFKPPLTTNVYRVLHDQTVTNRRASVSNLSRHPPNVWPYTPRLTPR